MENSKPIPRRQVIADAARTVGALSLGGGALGALAEGCARQPSNSSVIAQRLMHVQFTVQGALASTTANAFYYLCVINLTNNAQDPGPIPVVASPYGNSIAIPAAASGGGAYQTFVGYIQYDTASQAYEVYKCPTIGTGTSTVFQSAYATASFVGDGAPDIPVPPSAGSPGTFEATINLARLVPYPGAPIPMYAQVNFITYNYLISPGADSSSLPIPHYWDGIGSGVPRTQTDYAIVNTNTTETQTLAKSGLTQSNVIYNQNGTPVASTDTAVPNLLITNWSVAMQ